MATEVVMPKLGQTMESGVVTEWLAQEGQEVRRGEPLFKIESDKAVLDVNAPANGLLRKILVPCGTSAPILSPVAIIGTADEDISSYEALSKPKMEQPARAGQQTKPVPNQASPPKTTGGGGVGSRVVASPRAKRVARESGIDIENVPGTGPEGRVLEADVHVYLEGIARKTTTPRDAPEPTDPDSARSYPRRTSEEIVAEDDTRSVRAVLAGEDVLRETEAEREQLSGIRARISERMLASVHTTAAYTLTTEADAGNLVSWREALKARARQGDLVASYNDLLIRLVTTALHEYPVLNSCVKDGEVLRGRQVNVGLAVDTERGLVVPVLRDAERMRLSELAKTTADLVAKARDGRLSPDDMSGGTFTISNLGMYGTGAFTPIINVPEVAILGVGRIAESAVVRDGQVVVRPTVVLSLTVDHRLVDGAPAARFLQRLKQLVEEPVLAL